MSSSVLPSIEIECRLPQAARLAVVAAVATVVLVPWTLGLGKGTTVGVSLAGAVFLLLAFRRAGWMGGRAALRRIYWSSEGRWWLVDGRNEPIPARLRADSRVFSSWVWLRFKSPAGFRQVALRRGPRTTDAVRRLIVRLRLQGAAPPAGLDDAPH